ncbi:MAG: hypothetical protein KC503_06990 [Myxococcales bacterium]|nr:hypothetical protein [Myxococcales bacterium]
MRHVLLALLLVLPACFESRAPLEQGFETSAAECRDNIDNDGDGRTDCADEDCRAWSFCYQVDGAVRDLGPRFDSGDCNCDDGLACTDDSCLSNGSCFFQPRPGFCVIDGTCYRDRDENPKDSCGVCDSLRSPNGWYPRTNGACDDGDPCTRNDRCQAGRCRGTPYSCNDGLACTDDACRGDGTCDNKVRADKCLINGACADAGANRPGSCDVCDPNTSSTLWTLRPGCVDSGGACVELGKSAADGCTRCELSNGQPTLVKVDGCFIDGKCVAANATLGSCAVCDPSKSTSEWTVLPQSCLIAGACFGAGAAGIPCGSCDPSTNQRQWSIGAGQCYVDGSCFNSGDGNPNDACQVCDATLAQLAWSTAPNRCEIGRSCYADKQAVAGGCLVCDVSKSTTQWTAGTSNADVRFFGFEDGKVPADWSVMNSHMDVGWQLTNSGRAGGGSWSFYYGDPSKKSFDNGLANSGTITTEAFVVKAGISAGIRFWVYFDTQTSPFEDLLDVEVAPILGTGGRIWRRSVSTPQQQWQQIALSLSNWTGRQVRIVFRFDTVTLQNNSGEGVYLDDVTVFSGCQ